MRAIVTLPHCNNCIAHCTECGNLGGGTWPETLYVPLVRVWHRPIAMAEVISLGDLQEREASDWATAWKKVVEIMRNVVVGWWRAAGWPGKDESSHSDSDNCLWGRSRFAAAAKQGTRKNKESSLYHPIQKLKPFKCVVSCLFFFFFSIPYFIQANLKGIGKEAFLLILSQRTSTQYVKYWDAQVKVKTAWRRL